MDISSESAELRFTSLTNTYAGLSHAIEAINKLSASNDLDKISELYLQDMSGWGRAKVRELIIILESFGFLVVEKGKVTSVNEQFNESCITESKVSQILKKHVFEDEKSIAVVNYLKRKIRVGEKVPGERTMKKDMAIDFHIGREKLREALLRLECGGYLLRKGQKRRVLLKPVDDLVN